MLLAQGQKNEGRAEGNSSLKGVQGKKGTERERKRLMAPVAPNCEKKKKKASCSIDFIRSVFQPLQKKIRVVVCT